MVAMIIMVGHGGHVGHNGGHGGQDRTGQSHLVLSQNVVNDENRFHSKRY